MRALGFLALLIVLPLAARAETDPPAPAAAPTEGEAAPPQSPYTPGAAPPAEAPPAPVAPQQQAPSVAPPQQQAPSVAPAQQQAPTAAPAQQQAPSVAPPAAAFTPRPSPLLQPQYGTAPAPIYTLPSAPVYAPPTPPVYAPPPPQLYSPPPPVYLQTQPAYTAPAPAAPVYPAPLSLPALPQGYVYLPMPLQVAPTLQAPMLQPPMQQPPMPQPSSEQARREALYRQLQQLDSRLDQLQRTRVGVGGPITLMILSYGTALVAGAVSASSFGSAHDIKYGTYHHGRDLDFNDNGVVNHHDYRSFIRAGRISGGIAGAGLLLGFASTVRLFKNIGLRRAQASELRDLREQRGSLIQQLNYGASFSSNQLQLSVGGRF
ncbi:MAG: hypothetical protein JWN04_1059 [Myxococcaceae bacterium]|nr:hypothetical protein [Myxococcaceae bacterium]